MDKYTQSFPSGRSVVRCRQDAKSLVKSSKLTDSPIPLNAALDIIASDNGINQPWAEALKRLETSELKNPKIAQTHLLGHALNLLIQKGLIDMNSNANADDSYLECELVGKSTVINWSYISFGEIRLSVWWNFDKTKHPQHLEGGYKNKILLDDLAEHERTKYFGTKKAIFSTSSNVETYTTDEPLAKQNRYKNFVGVLCSTWVERKDGKYLQTEDGKRIFASYIRAQDKQALCTIPSCCPNGFDLTGRFHM